MVMSAQWCGAVEGRPEERYAAEVLRRVLGVEVAHEDDGSSPGMVDALFEYPDGRLGALEVTTLGDRRAMEREALTAKRDWAVEGAAWAWMVHVGDGVDLRDLAKHLPVLIRECEEIGVTDPRQVRGARTQSVAHTWLDGVDVRFHGYPTSRRHGAVDVLPAGSGGAVFEGLDGLPAWLEARLEEADLQRKLEKLRRTGREELHLFLRVHDTALPFSLYYPLAWGEAVPDGLDPPADLTGLWLAPAWRNPILSWRSDIGWSRADCFD